MALNTYIILCQFKQGDLATIQTVGEDLKNQAQGLSDTEDVHVAEMFLTTTDFEVVLVVEAQSPADASKVLELFAPCEPRQKALTLTVTTGTGGKPNAFKGHTKM